MVSLRWNFFFQKMLQLMLVLEGSKALEIIRIIADEYSRRVEPIGASRPFEIEELNSEGDIPLSTYYRRVRYLESAGNFENRQRHILGGR
jgi:hypothetical protein